MLKANIMTTTKIRHKLYDYIRVAEDKKIKAIYTMLEEEIEGSYDYWSDKNFLDELNKRSEDFKSGKSEKISWEDAKTNITRSDKQALKA